MDGIVDFFKALMVKGSTPSLILIVTCFGISLILVAIPAFWNVSRNLITGPLSVGFYYIFVNFPQFQVAILTFFVSFLIVGSLKPIIELYIQRQESRDKSNDADQLQKLTLIPYHFWIFVFLVISIFADGFSLYFLFRNFFS